MNIQSSYWISDYRQQMESCIELFLFGMFCLLYIYIYFIFLPKQELRFVKSNF